MKIKIPARSKPGTTSKENHIFSGALAENIFSKNLFKIPLPYQWNQEDVQNKYDTYNTYTLNSYNCRGPEFTNNVDFIFAGCSQTFGIGVPDSGVWPRFVAEALDGSYVNLSMLGAGMEWITDSIFKYIHTFGAPKRGIMVLAPDPYRIDLLTDNVLNSCPSPSITDYVPQYYDEDDLDKRLVTFHLKNKEPVNYLKRPFPIEDTTLDEESIRRTIKAIKDLEFFCAQTGIPLIWATWSDYLQEIVESLPFDYGFDNYLQVTHMRWEHRKDENGTPTDYLVGEKGEDLLCHSSIAAEYGLAFQAGTDRFKFNDGQSHMGAHQHMHVAQDFIERALAIGV